MKVLQISDTHIGITNPRTLHKLFKKMAEEEFDLLMHCGDYCGGRRGHKSVNTTVKMIREVLPDKPFLSVIGNHDYWHEGRKRQAGNFDPYNTYVPAKGFPGIHTYQQNYNKILDTFKENNVHFLDEDGLYQHPDFPDVVFMGHSGWYNDPNPPTNDQNYLPYGMDGNTHKWMERRARKVVFEQMDALDKIYETYMTVCFVSHFPVVNSVPDHKGSFHLFCWDEAIKEAMQLTYGTKYFFCGHAHKHCTGPLRYESGADYYKPKYHIVEVI